MSNIIDKIRLSGTDYTLSATSSGGNPTVELTQAEYDALVSAGTVSADTYYIITDAQAGDLTQYWTSAQTQSAITQATSGKVDSSSVVSSVTSASTDSEIPTAKAVWNVASQGGGGGGTTYSAGTNIDITNDTINCTLPISADTGGIYTTSSYPFTSTAPRSYNAVFGNSNVIDVFGGMRRSDFNALFGNNNGVRADDGDSSSHFIAGSYNNVRGTSNYQNALFGYYNNSRNNSEFGCGRYNNSVSTSTAFGNSGNTLFSVGNGTADNARHNAFEIRQNGDIYFNDGTNDVKLQDKFTSIETTIGDINTILQSI